MPRPSRRGFRFVTLHSTGFVRSAPPRVRARHRACGTITLAAGSLDWPSDHRWNQQSGLNGEGCGAEGHWRL